MKENKFKIGDKVKVVNSEHQYQYYDAMARIMGLKNWKKELKLIDNTFATVIVIEEHCSTNDVVIGIRTSNNEEYMIGYQGLELVDEYVNEDKVIQISRSILNEYYENATESQKTYINDNFKLDGTTTVKALIGLEKIACSKWKSIIRDNHPEYFSKVIDFSTYIEKYNSHIFTPQQSELLGFRESPIQIRSFGKYKHKGFYLSSNVSWEIKRDDEGVNVLIFTLK